jgi:hypothetical protein
LFGIYCIIGIRSGEFFIKSDRTILVSAVFALALLMTVYGTGMTLFFFINLFINKFRDRKYGFFTGLNSLMLLAFIGLDLCGIFFVSLFHDIISELWLPAEHCY